jgi:hypothetical protein
MLIPKTQYIRDEKHRRFVASLPCVICLSTDVQAAHVRKGQGGGTGLKPSDDRCVPLCVSCHRKQGEIGELKFWYGYGGYEAAAVLGKRLYANTGDKTKALRLLMEFR